MLGARHLLRKGRFGGAWGLLNTSSANPLCPRRCQLSTASAAALANEDDAHQHNRPIKPSKLRNVAIVAHVDHGKTTMVDQLLKASLDGGSDMERVMDSMSLEKERGITIMSKCTRLSSGDRTFNIVDTPGHADFGGEVERVVSMIDGVVLVVDATEGPMSQTKFVLGKALSAGKRPVVVINKADRAAARLDGEVENEIFELFASLGADDEQLDYPTLFASAKMGWATDSVEQAKEWSKNPPKEVQMDAIFDTIWSHVPVPCEDNAVDQPFAMAVNNIGYDNYLGQLATGKIEAGQVDVGQLTRVLTRAGNKVATPASPDGTNKVTGVFISKATARQPLNAVAGAGDIITLAGVNCGVGDTITCAVNPVLHPLFTLPLAPPTLAMTFGANNSPLAGRDGTQLTGTSIKERLVRETRNNITIRVEDCETDGDKMDVSGRGELQLGILIEEMRREGYEFNVSPPRILLGEDDNGETTEPVEEVTVDTDSSYSGMVIDKLTSDRKGIMLDMRDSGDGKARLTFLVPSRGLLGFGPEIKAASSGNAIVNSVFSHHAKYMGGLSNLSPGKIVSMENGKMTAYALFLIQDRGKLFVEAGEETYSGQVIGEHAKPGDLEVNPCREKKLTNVRSVNADEAIRLVPPVRMSVEDLISYMGDDEILEVTPKVVRLRKNSLNSNERAKSQRVRKQQLQQQK